MPIKLKHVFRLHKNDSEIEDLDYLSTEIMVAAMEMQQARLILIDALNDRNKLIQSLILNKFNTVLNPTDRIEYHHQLSEIKVFEDKGLLPNTMTDGDGDIY